jgi:hypothetical protein
MTMLEPLPDTAWSVLVAMTPLVMLFLLFQVLFLDLPLNEVKRVLTGTLVAAAGLFLFLLGVSFGFLPYGRAIGEALGASRGWVLVLFGLAIGFVTTWGEPAVRILADQVEEASVGSIRRTVVIVTVSLGVAFAVAAGMLRIAYGIPLWYFVVPGYLIVLALMWFTGDEYVGIAVDAGGVATGPLANTFLLALALGAASTMEGSSPLLQGLGLVTLISLAPVIALMALGWLIRWKEGRKEATIR